MTIAQDDALTHLPSSVFDPDELHSIVAVGQALSSRGLMPGSQGNISVRDPGRGLVAITPHDMAYDEMTIDDLVVLDATTGTTIAGVRKPSYELPTHMTVYRERADVQCVIHTEPTFVNVFGVLRREITPVITTGLKSAGGSVPLTEFSYHRDEEFALKMLEIMDGRHAVVWNNHGLLVIGASLHEATERSYGVEENAKVLYMASLLGTPASLEFVKDVGMVVA